MASIKSVTFNPQEVETTPLVDREKNLLKRKREKEEEGHTVSPPYKRVRHFRLKREVKELICVEPHRSLLRIEALQELFEKIFSYLHCNEYDREKLGEIIDSLFPLKDIRERQYKKITCEETQCTGKTYLRRLKELYNTYRELPEDDAEAKKIMEQYVQSSLITIRNVHTTKTDPLLVED